MAALIGERIILREYRKEDLQYIREWVNDSRIVDNLSDIFLYPHTLNATESFLNSILESKSDMKGFIIAHKDSEAYIGQIDLFKFDWKNRSVEMGIVIGKQDNHGKGYGAEAILLLQQMVFDQLNMNRFEIEVYDFNLPALTCYLKCGFKEEGRLREKIYKNGRYVDIIQMGMLQSEYNERKNKES